ncbi:MAG: amine oxidase [Anaerolineaceae bacterium]|nr:amine oxidase [Anaerolineaceae bacterium]
MKSKGKNVVIVGAGMAGLTAAAYLVKENYQVLLIDKNNRVGGLLSTFEKDGFFFDSGPRAFVNSGIVKPILKELDIHLEYLENIISIRVEDKQMLIDSMEKIKEYQRLLFQLYPENKTDIEKIISIISQLSEYTKVLYEFDNPNFGDVLQNKKFVFRKLIPWTFKFLHALRKFNQFNEPMEIYLKKLTNNQSLIDILTQFFFRQTPTYFALGYFYVYLDYFYPKGGTGVLASLVTERVLTGGGDIKLNTRIVEVDPSKSIVTDAEGESYQYDHLIWAADLKTLYQNLNSVHLDETLKKQLETQKVKVLSAKGAESVFILFLGVDRSSSYFLENGGSHMFFTPSKDGLGEISRTERQLLVESFDLKSKEDYLNWVEQYCRLNTYEVSIPALRDPDLAPDGQTGIMISCLFDYDIFEIIKNAGWYDEFKVKIENQIISIFSETVYKDLDQDVLFKFSSTPLSINKVSGSSEGAITGWSFESEVPVVNQLKDIPKSVLTPIPGIFQAGQWAYSPAGVPIAMLTGWYASQKIIKETK